MKSLIDKLSRRGILEKSEFEELLVAEEEERRRHEEDREISIYLFEKARQVQHEIYGNKIFIRGLIEISNYCKNDCYYCGIGKSNSNVSRYRLTKEDIMKCCESGYESGFRTFVLQGGEDFFYTDEVMVDIIASIKSKYYDCAVTLSLGEREYSTYKTYFDSGADRYLLRHETSNCEHYSRLHPKGMSLERRKQCLWDLKEIGFQVGCGVMVGSPFQTIENLAEDLIFMNEFSPHMVGIGPFIAHHDTVFAGEENGSLEQTLFMLGLIRIMLPNVLIPATTALGTIHPQGRERGILAGANVVMPNLSPEAVRKNYQLYDNKLCTGAEAAEGCNSLKRKMNSIGYEIVTDRGDFKK